MKSFKPVSKEEYIKIQTNRNTSNHHEYPLSPWHDDVFNEFKKYLVSPIVDIGTRNGLLVEILKEKGFDAYGIEITDIADFAKSKGRNVFKCDIQEKTPFEDKFFKSAVMTHTIEHCYDVEAALREIKRILDGHILIIFPAQSVVDIKYAHFTAIESINQLSEILKNNGFEIIRTYEKGIYCQTIIAKV